MIEQGQNLQMSGKDVPKILRVQYSTFFVSGRMYGVDVSRVQEVVRPMPMTRIPLAEKFVKGLINLRGQVVTAISLHDLFNLKENATTELMNVICKADGILVSLLVDDIGDVIELETRNCESVPNTITESVRQYMTGVYKVGDDLMSVIDVDKIFKVLNG
jgi:purine-binding chemotaxis protein CheW